MGDRIRVKIVRNHAEEKNIGAIGYIDGYVHIPDWGRYAIIITEDKVIQANILNLDVL